MSLKLPVSPLTNRSHSAFICGIDEVGRGPLAGPVVAACVVIPPSARNEDFWAFVKDSKKLSEKKRSLLAPFIRQHTYYAIAEASPEEIDTLNIHHATLLAMRRAYQSLGVDVEKALIDGKFCPDISCEAQAVVKGDSKHLEIAAASIIAKVERDSLMCVLHREFPYYGWDKNAGYGTAVHLEGIAKYGITPYHRQSFAPCANSTRF